MIKKFSIVVASMFLGLFLTAGVPLLAQTNPSNPYPADPGSVQPNSRPVSPAQPGGQTDGQPGGQTGGRSQPGSTPWPGAATPAAPNQAQLTEVDRQYMLDANRNAVAALALGQLALDRSDNDQVRQFVQAEIDEQTRVRSQLTQLAPTVGVNLPSAPIPTQQEVQTRLLRLSGQALDRAIMDEVGINAHLENAAIYQREAALGQNRDLVNLATQGLALITQHYNTASALTNYQVAQVPARVDAGAALNPNGNSDSMSPR